MDKKRLLIDTDPATGIPFRDVDDGLAILLALASPELTLEGVTINFGNVKAHIGMKVAEEVLMVAGAEIPFFLGAASKKDLGKSTPAVEFLLETVKANPGEISLLTIAPLTNVATAMMLDRYFAPNLKELIIMGGSFRFKPFAYFGEFNFHCDGRATSTVISAPVPKTVITMDLCSQAVFTRKHLARFQNSGRPMSKYIAENVEPWLKLNRIVFRKGGFFPWDVVAAAYLIDDTLFDQKPYTLSIREQGIRSGSFYNIVECEDFEKQGEVVPINIPKQLEAERFMKLFIDRLMEM